MEASFLLRQNIAWSLFCNLSSHVFKVRHTSKVHWNDISQSLTQIFRFVQRVSGGEKYTYKHINIRHWPIKPFRGPLITRTAHIHHGTSYKAVGYFSSSHLPSYRCWCRGKNKVAAGFSFNRYLWRLWHICTDIFSEMCHFFISTVQSLTQDRRHTT